MRVQEAPEPEVELAGEPEVRTARDRRWQLVASLAVIAVLAAGVVTWLFQVGDPEYLPPVVEGLQEEPALAWRTTLQEGQVHRATSQGVLLHPEEWTSGALEMVMLDADTGEESWRHDLSQATELTRAEAVSVRDLPATESLSLALERPDDSQEVLLIDATSGEVERAMVLPDDGVLVATNAGTYLVVTMDPEGLEGFSTISLLTSDDPDSVRWTATVPSLFELEDTSFREYQGYLGLGIDIPGVWWPGSNLVIDMATGEVPGWAGPGIQTAMFFPESVVTSNDGDLVAHDLGSGEELWRQEDCDCTPLEVDGKLFKLSLGDDDITDLMRLDPGDGEPAWDASLAIGSPPDNTTVRLAGDRAVLLQIPPDQNRTCVATIDVDTGQLQPLYCHPVGGFLMWAGEDQMILWDNQTLGAAGLDEGELRWQLDLPGWEVTNAGSRLLVHHPQRGTIGVLE